jgi:HK97 family phage prohead protease
VPWHVAKSSKCPNSKPWACIKDSDGSIEGCHATKAAAQKQMAALYAQEPGMSSAEGPSELRYAVAPITNVEVRDPTATDDNTWTMSGYAAVFNETTTLLNSKFIRLTESIDQRAFNRVLSEQPLSTSDGVVHFNFGHDMTRAVAATDVPAGKPGSLELSTDKRGLRFLAKVPRDDPDGIAMAVKMRNGVVRQASFAFTINEASYDYTEAEEGQDTEHRTILDVQHLYDVCATPQGAYSSTEAGLRSYGASLGQPQEWGGQHRQPDSGGEIDVSRESEGDESNTWLTWEEIERETARRRPIKLEP